MLLMEKSEFDNWSKTRVKGKRNYILKTSLTAFLLIFFAYFLANGYIHWDNIYKYIRFNLGQIPRILLGAILSIVMLSLLCLFFWNFNEKRYNATLKETGKNA